MDKNKKDKSIPMVGEYYIDYGPLPTAEELASCPKQDEFIARSQLIWRKTLFDTAGQGRV